MSPKIATLINPVIALLTQSIGLVSVPLIAIHYSAELYGKFALIQISALVLSTLFLLRLELTIPLTRDEDKKCELASACLLLLLITFFLSLALTASISFLLPDVRFFWMAVILAFNLSLIQLTVQLLTSDRMYIRSGLLLLFQTIVTLSIQYLIAQSNEFLEYGLPLGTILGSTAVLVFCTPYISRRFSTQYFKQKVLMKLLSKNYEFIKFNTLSGLLFTISSNWPVVLLGAMSGPQEAGLFAMAKKLVDSGTRLLDGSLRNIVYGEYVRRSSNFAFRKISNIYFFSVGTLTIVVSLLLLSHGQQIIGYAFSKEWSSLHIYTLALMPMFFGINATTPFKVILMAEGGNSFLFKINLLIFILRPTVLFISLYVFHLQGEYAVALFSLCSLFVVASIRRKSLQSLSKSSIVINKP